MTSFIELTDMWHDHEYLRVGQVINNESWSVSRVAEFCAYFSRHVGVNQLHVLHKFL